MRLGAYKLFAAMILAAMSMVANAGVLTTTFASNNGQSGNMFDVVTLGGPLTVTGLDLNLDPGTWTIDVYKKAGTWVGFSSTPGAWTLIDSASVASAGYNTPTFFNVTDFLLGASTTTGLYVTTTTSDMNYTNGTAVGDVAAANSDLQILEGAGVSYPFGSLYTPRIWNGSIHYKSAASVPEPGSFWMFGIGLIGLGIFGWRRRAQARACQKAAF